MKNGMGNFFLFSSFSCLFSFFRAKAEMVRRLALARLWDPVPLVGGAFHLFSVCVCVFSLFFTILFFFHRPENGRKRVPSLVSWPHPILWKIISPFNDLREAAEEKLIRKQSILVHKIQYEIH